MLALLSLPCATQDPTETRQQSIACHTATNLHTNMTTAGNNLPCVNATLQSMHEFLIT
jgi:hypothetical protein